MILDEVDDSVNSTVIQHVQDDTEHLLSPGAIAAITICTTFVFYLTIMVIVCVGEYCQYINGKKQKVVVRRSLQSGLNRTDTHLGKQQASIHEKMENAVIQPERISSSISQSESRDGLLVFEPPSNDDTADDRYSGIVQVHIEDRLSQLETDCVETCDAPYLTSDPEVTMVPLMIKQCEEMLEPDVEILCDSADSRDMYRLEADV